MSTNAKQTRYCLIVKGPPQAPVWTLGHLFGEGVEPLSGGGT